MSGFDDLLPGKVAQSGGFDGEQTTSECGEIGIDVVVADARAAFEHLAVADPMVNGTSLREFPFKLIIVLLIIIIIQATVVQLFMISRIEITITSMIKSKRSIST